jgi:hypothetical protein
MFDIPYYNFNYDETTLDLHSNKVIKQHVLQIYDFLLQNVMNLDFEGLCAVQYEQIAEIKAILDSKDNEHSQVIYHLINHFRLNPNNPGDIEECGLLHQFCAFGNLNAVKYLFQNYPLLDVNAKSHILQSPIQFAVAIAKSPEIADYLLDKLAGVLFNVEEQDSFTLPDALAQRWVESDSSEEFFQTWGSFLDRVLKQDNFRVRVEDDHKEFYIEIASYQWGQLNVKLSPR